MQSKISTQLTTEEAKDFLDQSDDFSPIKPATQKMAGYATKQDQQLALALENKSPTIYVSAGDSIVPIVHLFKEVEHYPASRLRSAGLAANAPKLDVGNDMVKVVVPTMSTLIALCEAYEGSHTPAPKSGPNVMTDRDKPAPPLNQILYGPPGTGKTYATVDAALEILAPDLLNSYQEDRAVLKAQFDSLVAAGHIRFVTFHQSFSYEEFVEGLRADKGHDSQLRYARHRTRAEQAASGRRLGR